MERIQEQLGDPAAPPHVLLTGATGFVGTHVAEEFAQAGFRVRALVRSAARGRRLAGYGFEIVLGSLADEDVVNAACTGVDVVVHLAALTHARSDAEYEQVNVAGTQRLLDAALAARPGPRRFVYLSSLAAAGPCVDGRGVTADDEPRPLTAYGRSKLAGERVLLEAADRIEVAILRAPAVYGPHDTDLYHFFRFARLGVVPVPTGPARPLQLVHVADLAAALVRAVMVDRASGVYHIAERRMYTWEQIGRLVGEAVGRSVRVVRVPAGLIAGLAAATEWTAALTGSSSIFNRDKAREMLAPGWLCETETARVGLGYETQIDLADGLRRTAQWYRDEGWL